EPCPEEPPRQHPALRRAAVARSMFGPAEDPSSGSEMNSDLANPPPLVASLPLKLHLRLAIAQSQEQLASKDFGVVVALPKIRERRRERQSTLSREAGARSRQPTPETGPRQPPPQPRRARQTPTPRAANVVVEAESA